MTDITPIVPKLDPLIRMLASDTEPEALAALRAIGRTLTKAGASFHDLADAVANTLDDENGDDRRGRATRHPDFDFIVPKRWKPAPKPAGPPLWEKLERNGRLAWLDRVVVAEQLSADHRTVAAALRAQFFSQPHKTIKPAQAAAINAIFGEAWLADLRPIADIAAGDPRMPLRWTGTNRQQAKTVLQKALSFFSAKDAIFAGSVISRIETSRHALSQASVDEVEKIESLLLKAYDAGARP